MNNYNFKEFLEQLESFSPYPSVFSSHVIELLLTIGTTIKLANLSSSKRGNSNSDSEKFITKLSIIKSPVLDLLTREQELNKFSLLIMKMPKTTDEDMKNLSTSIEKLLQDNIELTITLAKSSLMVLETVKNYKENFNEDNKNDIRHAIDVISSIYVCTLNNSKNLIQQLKSTRQSLDYIKRLDNLEKTYKILNKK